LILTIACANYVNLTTARAAERAREVGVRKVIGATRKQLFSQFMGESILTVLLALLVSLLIVKLLLPSFNTIAARQFEFSSLFAPILLLPLVIILIVIGFFGSLYPALILSGFRPVRVLKGNFKTDISAVWLRKSLIVVQFIISVGLIASTIVIHNQLSFIQHKKLGYDRNHVLVLRSDRIIQGKMNTIKSELLSNPNVRGVTICSQTPVFIPGKYSLTFGDRQMNITAVRADMDFIKTMGLELKSGSDFTRFEEEAAFAETDTIERSLIINEAAVAYFGWNNQSAVGKPLLFQGAKSKVIGVVGNFHFSSMREPIQPFVIFLSNYSRNVLVKLSGNQLPQTLEFIKAKWRLLAPHRPFEYEFLDDQFNKLYEAETRTGKIFYSFALLAIALASLGLLGLSTFTAFQRTKEIGIRRVLGASVTGIVALLSKDFLKLVGIAAVIALPFAWWAMNKWLQDFAYRTKLGWDVFLLTAAIALFIAFITVSFQAIRAAIANPVKSLRTE
jgi:putative ABC transport system permease protein